MSTLGCVCALFVPTTKCGALLLAIKTRAWSTPTDVGCGVLQIIISWGCDIQVRLAGVTSMGPWGAPILFHDDSRPIWMEALWVLHKHTFTATTNATIIRIASTTTIVLTHELRQGI